MTRLGLGWLALVVVLAGCTDADPASQSCADEERVRLYPDMDGDGFGAEASPGELVCSGARGYVVDNTDCADADPNAHPGQTTASESPITGAVTAGLRFDYNCDGVEKKSLEMVSTCAMAVVNTGSPTQDLSNCRAAHGGWTTSTAPACGATAAWGRDCAFDGNLVRKCYASAISSKTQTCL